MKEMVGGCCVCSDERGWLENPLVYCDGPGCSVAVHQACYGIVKVPSGNWYCERCESGVSLSSIRCALCPMREGALKHTADNDGWAHVICALYIPEVRFGNVSTMSPIDLHSVPADRFEKICYICERNGEQDNVTVGACMQCNRNGCLRNFHVTCAQQAGLLCEESGAMDNIKYCGYCDTHLRKLKKDASIKVIPPYRPPQTEDNFDTGSDDRISGKTKLLAPPITQNNRLSRLSPTPPAEGFKEKSDTNASSFYNCVNNDGDGASVDTSGSTLNNHNSALHVQVSEARHFGAEHALSNSVATAHFAPNGPSLTAPSSSSTGTLFSASAFATVGNELIRSTKVNGAVPPVATVHASSRANDWNLTTQNDPLKANLVHVSASPSVAPPVGMASVQKVTAHAFSASQNVALPAVVNDSSVQLSLSPAQSAHVPRMGNGSFHEPVNVTKPSAAVLSGSVDAAQSTDTASSAQGTFKVLQPKSEDLGTKASTLLLLPSPSRKPEPNMLKQAPIVAVGSGDRKRRTDGVTVGPGRPPKDRLIDSSLAGKRARRTNSISKQQKTSNNNNVANMESLLEQVSPVVADTVSSFQQERVAAAQQQTFFGGGSKNGSNFGPSTISHALVEVSSSHQPSGLGLNNPVLPVSSGNLGSALTSLSHITEQQTYLPSSSTIGPPKTPSVLKSSPSISSIGLDNPTLPFPSSLEQLLERQWEQGSQFLMDQAQHFDIASLLSCLNQLKMENQRLEEHVNSLSARRDHLLAVSARLSLPLGSATGTTQRSPRVSAYVPLASDVSGSLSQDNLMIQSTKTLRSPQATSLPLSTLCPSVSSTAAPKAFQQPSMSPSGRCSAGVINSTFPPVGTSSSVFAAVKKDSFSSGAEVPSPDRSFAMPRVPTPLQPAADLVRPQTPLAALSSHFGLSQLSQEQQSLQSTMLFNFMQQQQMAVYGAAAQLSAAGLLSGPTSPHRTVATTAIPVHLLQQSVAADHHTTAANISYNQAPPKS